MAPKKTEVRLVKGYLEKAFTAAEQDGNEVDLDELAAGIISELDIKRIKDDDLFAAVVWIPLRGGDGKNGVWKGLGPYPTKHRATTEAMKMAAPGPSPGVGRVVKLERDAPT